MSNGERRHETCRYGTLTPAWRIEAANGAETATVMPLCTWGLPDPCPPAVKRGWGGAVEFARDCAMCAAHTPVDRDPSAARSDDAYSALYEAALLGREILADAARHAGADPTIEADRLTRDLGVFEAAIAKAERYQSPQERPAVTDAGTKHIRFVFAPRMGLAGLRIGHRYFKLKAPWNRPLFSERYGYERTLWRLGGWRLLRRDLSSSKMKREASNA